ncbi:MAG: arsenate reductase (glutaredoxin) [Opitutaceae bacterium]
MPTSITYNPRCSKCRQTLELLRQRGIEPELLLYLEEPLTKRELTHTIQKLKVDPRVLVRFNEPLARELGLSPVDERSRSAWIDLLTKNPALIERPIVIRGERAVLGRPPENVLGLL